MKNQPEISRHVRFRAAILAIVAGIVILAIKYYAAVISGSAALRSDAMESVINVVAAVFALGAVLFAEKPADREHPYGHGKIEHFSAVFEGGLIALAAVFIAWEAVTTLHEQFVLNTIKLKIDDLGDGIIWSAVGGGLNGILGLYLIFTGKSHRSRTIEADGHHILSDFWTTVGALVGLFLVKTTGLYWLDPIMALVVAILLARTGYRLVKQSSQALLDIEDPVLLRKLLTAMNQIRPPEVIAVHKLRTMRSGRYIHVDIQVVMPGHYPLHKSHDLAEGFGSDVVAKAGIEGELHIHTDPCQQNWCKDCAVDGCTLRKEQRGDSMNLTMESNTAHGDI